jgi:hypothetical protein
LRADGDGASIIRARRRIIRAPHEGVEQMSDVLLTVPELTVKQLVNVLMRAPESQLKEIVRELCTP